MSYQHFHTPECMSLPHVHTNTQNRSVRSYNISHTNTLPLERMVIQPLRKHAYSNILKISPPKTESFQKKKF